RRRSGAAHRAGGAPRARRRRPRESAQSSRDIGLGIGFAVAKAGPLGDDVEESSRCSARLISAGLPFADGLLADAELLSHFLLRQTKGLPQSSHPPGVPLHHNRTILHGTVYTRNMRQSAAVVIVGGGVIGTSVAYH